MFAVLGVAGLFCIQQWAHREQVKQRTAAALKSALKAAGRTARLSSSSDRRSASSDSSRSSWQQHGRGLKDGSFVCFKDRTGQVAVIQPYGNGCTWQLAVTCASGGCCLLPEGAGNLAHVSSDAVFLVKQVGSNYAFACPGAEGRYLSAVRDLAVAPVLDSTKLSPAAQWKVTASGISNVMHPHKKLSFSVADVRLVPAESIAAVEHSIAEFNKTQQDKVCAAQAVSHALQCQLQEAAKHLNATTEEYDEQVELLKGQLREACSFNTQLTGLVDQKGQKLALMKEHFDAIKTKYQDAERELSTAYTEVATLQQQLAERDDDVTALQARMMAETRQWNQLRSALQDSLAAKDEEITGLNLQVQRMEHALRAVEHTLCGMRKPRRLDRASLDALSITQLQAAVDSFAAVGEGAALMMAGDDMSHEEAEALRVLLAQQTAAGLTPPACPAGQPLGPGAFDPHSHTTRSGSYATTSQLLLEPGTELSLHDLDRMDQTSPDKHSSQHSRLTAAAAVGGGGGKTAAKSPKRGAAAAGGAGATGGQQQAAAGRRALWSSSGAAGGVAGRELLSTWGLSDDTAVSSSRGARSSATSEGRHRYAGDASDCDSADGDDDDGDTGGGAAGPIGRQEAAAGGRVDAAGGGAGSGADGLSAGGGAAAGAGDESDGELDAVTMCTSMDEDELQQQLGRLKASASQLTSSASSSRNAATSSSSGGSSGKPPLPQGPLHTHRPTVGGGSSMRPYSSSLSQLSPVKEEHAAGGHLRSKSSGGAASATRSSSRY